MALKTILITGGTGVIGQPSSGAQALKPCSSAAAILGAALDSSSPGWAARKRLKCRRATPLQ
jgi:hypothetical protein